MSTGRGRLRRHERGSSSVMVLVLLAALTTMALAGATVDAVLLGQRRAAAAADMAALAAAQRLSSATGSALVGVDPCTEAGQVSAANHARLTTCLVEGADVMVEVAVDAPSAFGAGWSIPGRARAGPARVSDSAAPPWVGPATASGGPAR